MHFDNCSANQTCSCDGAQASDVVLHPQRARFSGHARYKLRDLPETKGQCAQKVFVGLSELFLSWLVETMDLAGTRSPSCLYLCV